MHHAGSHAHEEIAPCSEVNVPRCIKTWKKTLVLQEKGNIPIQINSI